MPNIPERLNIPPAPMSGAAVEEIIAYLEELDKALQDVLRLLWVDLEVLSVNTYVPHAATHSSGGTDPVLPADIGAASATHLHSATDIVGQVADADTVDGQHAAAFAPASHVGAGGGAHAVATSSAAGFMSTADKAKLDGIQAGAEVNQNAFAQVKVGATTISADSKTDVLELAAGANIALTPDAANDKVTIAVTGAVPQATNADTVDGLHAADLQAQGLTWIVPGDTIVLEALAERFVSALTDTVVKQFLVVNPGAYRLTGELKSSWSGSEAVCTITDATGRVLGTFSTSATSYTAFTLDLQPVSPVEVLRVYLRHRTNGETAYVRNVRVRGVPGSQPAPAVVVN